MNFRPLHASFRLALIALGPSIFAGCAPEFQQQGDYRVVTARSLGCQPRSEFYFADAASPNSKPTFLGVCFTPRFVSHSMNLPADPSCFAIAGDGKSIVYFHLPNICGASDRAKEKIRGVYLHSPATGDRLLYAGDKVGQIWSRREIEEGAIRVSWSSRTPSQSGAQCGQTIVISAKGDERTDENQEPPNPRCGAGTGGWI